MNPRSCIFRVLAAAAVLLARLRFDDTSSVRAGRRWEDVANHRAL